MPAPKGNQFWKARTKHGRDKIFKDSGMLWESCCEYFQWIEDNPLYEEKLFAYQGEISMVTVTKMRAMTISGLCLFLDCTTETWYQYRKEKDFSDICKQVEETIYNQKFAGASADLLNHAIIARELGLTDKKEVEHSGEIKTLSNEELDAKIRMLTSDEG